MKKMILCTISCTIMYHSSCLGMLVRIAAQKTSLTNVRTLCTGKNIHYFYDGKLHKTFSLPKKNIFDTSIDTMPKESVVNLVNDLWYRNRDFAIYLDTQQKTINNQSFLLEEQNDILVDWLRCHTKKLDVKRLKELEEELKKTYMPHGHANE